MSLSSPRLGQCIFCQFRIESRRPRRIPSTQTTPFSTCRPLARTPIPKSRRDGRGDTPNDSYKRPKEPSLRITWGVRGPRDPKGPHNGRGRAGDKSARTGFGGSMSRAITRFPELLEKTLVEAEAGLRTSPVMSGLSEEDVDTAIANFQDYIQRIAEDKNNKTADALRASFLERGYPGIRSQLQYAFYSHVLGSKFTKTDIDNQKALADLRFPLEWFPDTRAIQRTVHVHIGPTNSGKTYHALKRLEQATKGVYAGPLRLLAHEVYTRMNASGKDCALVTGEEIRLPDGWNDSLKDTARIISCTVEMAPTKSNLDVAVIDEIQMLADEHRGWAWTNAFVGIQATEVHVCGEERALPLIERLSALMGDKVIIHRYERLTTLKPEGQSLKGDVSKMRKGDCLVTFSVMGIHALRAQIEKLTGRRVAIIYGSLPPETRAAQARLFNDPDNDYDFLVASDAIGMGLNLSIKRVIFETIQKNNGVKVVTLTNPEIRQIAGRAGRYKVAPQSTESTSAAEIFSVSETVVKTVSTNPTKSNTEEPTDSIYPAPPPSLDSRPPFDKHTIGLVTTLEQEDYQTVVRALETPAMPLRTAGILPPDDVIYRFCNYFPPGTPFSYMLMRLHEICQSSHGFHLCRLKDQVKIADVIHDIPNLDIIERLQLASAPVAIRDQSQQSLIKAMATCIAEQKGGALLDLPCLDLEVLDKTITGTRPELKELETLHKGLVMYMWLSFRFPGVFTTRPLANHTKELVEGAIEKCLRMLNFQDRAMARKRLREKSLLGDLHEDILKQQWSGEAEEGVVRDKVLEGELQAAAIELENEEDGLLVDGGEELEKGSFDEGTATNEMGVDDEGEYPEEDENEDGEEILEDEVIETEILPVDVEEAVSPSLVDVVEEKEDGAKPSVTIPFKSIQPQHGDARP